jgi:hypothetical protein
MSFFKFRLPLNLVSYFQITTRFRLRSSSYGPTSRSGSRGRKVNFSFTFPVTPVKYAPHLTGQGRQKVKNHQPSGQISV